MAEPIFDDNFFDTLPSDPHDALLRICDHFESRRKRLSTVGPQLTDAYVEAFGLLQSFAEAHEIALDLEQIGGRDDHNQMVVLNGFRNARFKADQAVRERETKDRLSSAKQRYSARLGKGLVYEFTDDDYARVQRLLNQLRDLIRDSEVIDTKHKIRLLARLEKLQAELHQKMTTLDMFWPLLGEAKILAAQYGKAAKEVFDTTKEVLTIIVVMQAMAQGVPLPQLPDLSAFESDRQKLIDMPLREDTCPTEKNLSSSER